MRWWYRTGCDWSSSGMCCGIEVVLDVIGKVEGEQLTVPVGTWNSDLYRGGVWVLLRGGGSATVEGAPKWY